MKLTLTFHSHYEALKTKKQLLSSGCEVKLVSVPRSLSSDCGTAAVTECDLAILDTLGIEGAYVEEEGGWRRIHGATY